MDGLTLGRKLGDAVYISDGVDVIVVTVAGVKSGCITRLNIQAPQRFKILRAELVEDDGQHYRDPAFKEAA